MRYYQVISSLAAIGAASPLVEYRSNDYRNTLARRSYHSSEVLDACANATNCETYESSRGTLIRFKEGMGPSSESYAALHAHSKRDDNGGTNTHVTLGDASIMYGTTGASGSGGLFHHLYDSCHEGSCDTSAATYSSSAVIGGALFDVNLILHPNGQYDGWDQRNIFVDALVAVAGQGEKWEDVTWYQETNPETGQRTPEGTQHQSTQSNFISINRFKDGNLQGFITAQVEQENEGTGWCATISGVLGDISGVVGAIPGAGEAAGIAGGFFGLINSLCS